MIDDDLSLTELVKEYAAPDGFEVTGAASGESGLQALVKAAFSLVVLDVMLPQINGLDLLCLFSLGASRVIASVSNTADWGRDTG